jgi:hypothetical protein
MMANRSFRARTLYYNSLNIYLDEKYFKRIFYSNVRLIHYTKRISS